MEAPIRRRAFTTLLGSAAAAMAWPLEARAQQPAMPVIGFLSSGSPAAYANRVAAFRNGLGEQGFTEGRNIRIEFRWAEGRYDLLPALAADLVSGNVAVIVASGGDATSGFAKAATSTIPIVAAIGGLDPVKSDLVDSLNRPGRNITAVSFFSSTLLGKRLELLCELVPSGPVGILLNPKNPITPSIAGELKSAALSLNRQIVEVMAAEDADLEAAFNKLVDQKTAALLVGTDPFLTGRRERLVALAQRHAIPAGYAWREFVDAGGLMSYGTSITEVYRLIGVYTARILRGTRPAELPVLQPTKFELVINLKTAKALRLKVPTSILLGADEVIE
jgi:putative tryptophan/tyrosine transport system substrate-binding protein